MVNVRIFPCLMLACLWGFPAGAQGMMSDVMSGTLVNPRVGAFAWYNLRDDSTGKTYFLRQAIVGEERVKRKDAYWLETELTPEIGYSSVYKMLLTGPASDSDNVHRLLVREGNGEVQEVSLDDIEDREPGKDNKVPRASTGVETVVLPNGTIEAEHFVIEEDGQTTELWISDEVPPMGLVKMKTPQGELSLQRYGTGGKDGESAIPTPSAAGGPDKDLEEGEPDGDRENKVRTNFGGRKRGR